MLQWILQHHLAENVLKFGLCAEAAVLLLEMVRFTVDKVSILLEGQCSVNGWIKSPGETDSGGSPYLYSLVLLCPQRAILNMSVSRAFQGAQLLPGYAAQNVMSSCLRETRDRSSPQQHSYFSFLMMMCHLSGWCVFSLQGGGWLLMPCLTFVAVSCLASFGKR